MEAWPRGHRCRAVLIGLQLPLIRPCWLELLSLSTMTIWVCSNDSYRPNISSMIFLIFCCCYCIIIVYVTRHYKSRLPDKTEDYLSLPDTERPGWNRKPFSLCKTFLTNLSIFPSRYGPTAKTINITMTIAQWRGAIQEGSWWLILFYFQDI